jgi:hypothetical protein
MDTTNRTAIGAHDEGLGFDSLSDPRLLDLYSFWLGNQHDGAIPNKAKFTPEALRPWLGNLTLIEIEATSQYRYRLYGTNFLVRFGVEMTAKTVDSLPSEQASLIRNDYDLVIKHRKPLARRYTHDFAIMVINYQSDCTETQTWERLILPLSDDEGNIKYLLVGAYEISTKGTIPLSVQGTLRPTNGLGEFGETLTVDAFGRSGLAAPPDLHVLDKK